MLYASSQGRKVVEDTKALGELLKNPNKYAFMILGAVLLLLVLAVLLVKAAVKLFQRAGQKRN